MKKVLLIAFSLICSISFGQNANWIYVPNTSEKDAGLYLFRKRIQLNTIPNEYVLHISADNRYKLFVNEQLVSVGPALGDLENYNYNTIDIASFLKEGSNIIAAKVWNEGSFKPVNQLSRRSAFYIEGLEEASVLNTDDSWKCIQDNSFTPIGQTVLGYYAAGANEKIDMKLTPHDWKKVSFNDASWEDAAVFNQRSFNGFGMSFNNGWNLKESIIPEMELKPIRFAKVRKVAGATIPKKFPSKAQSFEVKANSKATLLLDQSELTNAYTSIKFSGGDRATLVLSYAEALYDKNQYKNNRNEIEGKELIGRRDTIISSGAKNQEFTTLSYRTYRYVELAIQTADQPITIDDVYGTFTGYPFEMNAKLNSNNSEMEDILKVGWRTARLCSVDTYMDCPYYERLQYIGDARIQMMISYYNSGDDRLAKNAVNLWDQSIQKGGLTLSRYPDAQNQVIPTYSLWHISALHDYMFYGKDRDFVKTKLFGTRQILNNYISHIDEEGFVRDVPGWNFTDWVPDWKAGVGPMDEKGRSAMIDLQLLLALQSAIDLETKEGSMAYSKMYASIAKELTNHIQKAYWDSSKGLYADTPNRDVYSQHTNSMAILAGLTDDKTSKTIAQKMMKDKNLSRASIYFSYYLHMAYTKAGYGNQYLDWLDVWRRNLELGMTTWGEDTEVENTRSDCHAWGSSPNVEFYRTILGIQSSAPYFEQVIIEPHLADINKIGGSIPHPKGIIEVSYKNTKEGLKASIELPDSITGVFKWNNKEYRLHQGTNELICK